MFGPALSGRWGASQHRGIDRDMPFSPTSMVYAGQVMEMFEGVVTPLNSGYLL